jgi:hypothetical protein
MATGRPFAPILLNILITSVCSDFMEELQLQGGVSLRARLSSESGEVLLAFVGKRKLDIRPRKKSSSIHVVRWESGETDENPAKLTRIRRFWREARDADQKWIIRNQISGTVTGNPSIVIGFPKNLSGMLDCRLAIEKTNHDWPFVISFPETSLAMTDC